MAQYRIIRQRVRVTRHPERMRRLVCMIVDEGRQTVDWSYSETEARRKLAALQRQEREAA